MGEDTLGWLGTRFPGRNADLIPAPYEVLSQKLYKTPSPFKSGEESDATKSHSWSSSISESPPCFLQASLQASLSSLRNCPLPSLDLSDLSEAQG